MLKTYLKVTAILYIVTISSGFYIPQLSYRFLDEFSDDLNVKPFVKVGNKLYNFGQSPVSWYKASLICRSMGGFLASYETKAEWQQLSKYIIEKFGVGRFWWISGSDIDSEGDFFWYRTGERIGYANWASGEPDTTGKNENCVNLRHRYSEYQMFDSVCNEKLYYICEMDNPKTVVLSIL